MDNVTLDGRDLSLMLLDDNHDDRNDDDRAMFHYCGETLHAVRIGGRWKAHYFTAMFEDEGQEAPRAVICACVGAHVRTHNPPLLFDIREDITERSPINASHPKYRSVLSKVRRAVAAHRRNIPEKGTVENQLNILSLKGLLRSQYPCCGENCECDREAVE